MSYSSNKRAFCCAFDVDLYSDLTRYSKENNISMASVVNIALDKFLHSDSVSKIEVLSDIREVKNILQSLNRSVKYGKF